MPKAKPKNVLKQYDESKIEVGLDKQVVVVFLVLFV